MHRKFKQYDNLKRAEVVRDSVNGTIFVKPNKKIVVIPAKMKAFVAKGILGQYIYIRQSRNERGFGALGKILARKTVWQSGDFHVRGGAADLLIV